MRRLFASRVVRIVLWLVIVLTAGAYDACRFFGPSPLQTDLLALLPASGNDPVARRAVEQVAHVMGDKAFFALSSADASRARAAARALRTELAKDDAFKYVIADLPAFDPSSFTRFYQPYRFGLLSADDRRTLTAHAPSLDDLLARRLNVPMQAGLSTSLEADPFGWLQRFLADLPFSQGELSVDDNMLVARHGGETSVFVTAQLAASAYEASTQRAVRLAVRRAEARVNRDFPGVSMQRTGAVFYADAARLEAEGQVHVIGAVSVLGIALLMLWVFRSATLIALGFLSTAIGVLCALAVTLAIFGKLHLLTLVFGASLIGEAVDYSIQYFVAHLALGRDWTPARGVRNVRGGLTIALGTSLFGYALLATAPFPALEQIACFAIVGLGAACASVLTLLPALLRRPPKRIPSQLFERAGRLLDAWRRALAGRRGVFIACAIVVASVPGWLHLTSDDDIHLLIRRDASLAQQEQAIRTAMGFDGGSQFFLVQGDDAEAVLQRSEALVTRLDPLIENEHIKSVQSVTAFVPSARMQNENARLLNERASGDEAAVSASLIKAGFRESVAHAYVDANRAIHPPLTIETWLASPLSAPYRHLWLGRVPEGHFAAIVLPLGANDNALNDLRTLAPQLPGVTFVDEAARVSAMFGRYREGASLWLAAAVLAVFASLAWRYGWRAALAASAPVTLAAGVALAVFGYARMPLNLFNWLALMLVLCVGSNYAVFLREGIAGRAQSQGGAVWTGVLLSALTALLSFGMLAFTSMPALRSFGITLSAGIALSALLAPMGLHGASISNPEESR